MIYVITVKKEVDSCCCGNLSTEVDNILEFMLEHKKDNLDINKLYLEFRASMFTYENMCIKARNVKANLTKDNFLKRKVLNEIRNKALTFKEFLIKEKKFKETKFINYSTGHEYNLS